MGNCDQEVAINVEVPEPQNSQAEEKAESCNVVSTTLASLLYSTARALHQPAGEPLRYLAERPEIWIVGCSGYLCLSNVGG
jgi:hypothetical protein